MKKKIGEMLVATCGGLPLTMEVWGEVKPTRQDGRDYLSVDLECVSRCGFEEHRLGLCMVSWPSVPVVAKGGH